MPEDFIALTDTACLARDVIFSFPDGPYKTDDPKDAADLMALARNANSPEYPISPRYGKDTVHRILPDKQHPKAFMITQEHISTLPENVRNEIRRLRHAE